MKQLLMDKATELEALAEIYSSRDRVRYDQIITELNQVHEQILELMVA
jgi:hypothetical protein